MKLLPGFLAFVLSTSQAFAYPALVISVHDGDTIRVRRHNSAIERIRLASIDAPELTQPLGLAARSLTETLTLGRTVQVAERGHDRYGRVVATVTNSRGTNVNRELVRQGLAWWYQDFDPHNTGIEKLQAQARKKRIGIWANRNRVAPWDYRRTVGEESSNAWNKRRTATSMRTETSL